MGVISFSPLQWIYWYDKPSDSQGEPELEFFRHLPTVWDDTKVIHGRIGEYATIARRSGDEWFLGTVNDSHPRTLQIPLTFLATGKKYTAHIYADDDRVPTRTKVAVAAQAVDAATTLDAALKAGGGQAIWIEPARP
jgi:alpha-glucosidase